MPSTPIRILIVAALCVLSLIGLVVHEGMARASGAEVVMAMAGVDPRSILSGNYVGVSLAERLTPDKECPQTSVTTPWVALTSDGRLAHVAGAATTRQEALQLGTIAVLGSYYCNRPVPASDGIEAMNGSITTTLGIERVYLSQSDATRVTDLLRHASLASADSPVDAILSIGQDGRARLKGLMVNGQRMELNWL